MDFKGKRALITGASSGIGAVFARDLAAQGADLVLTARSQDRLDALAQELTERHGVAVDVIAIDLGEPNAGRALAAQVESRGLTIDLLVNNAGLGLHSKLQDCDPDTLSNMVAVNVTALVDLTRAFLPAMLQRDHGAIINVASTAGYQPVPYMAVYGATKAFVLSFTEALWAETRGTGVRVTTLCPGATATAFFDVAGDDAALGARMKPEAVVAAGLGALKRRRSAVIPGFRNRMLAVTTRFGSRQLTARIAERAMRPKA